MTGFLDGRRILVVEDEYLLALDIQEAKEDRGATVVGPVGQLEPAVTLTQSEALDGAILDLTLYGEDALPLPDRFDGIPCSPSHSTAQPASRPCGRCFGGCDRCRRQNREHEFSGFGGRQRVQSRVGGSPFSRQLVVANSLARRPYRVGVTPHAPRDFSPAPH